MSHTTPGCDALTPRNFLKEVVSTLSEEALLTTKKNCFTACYGFLPFGAFGIISLSRPDVNDNRILIGAIACSEHLPA